MKDYPVTIISSLRKKMARPVGGVFFILLLFIHLAVSSALLLNDVSSAVAAADDGQPTVTTIVSASPTAELPTPSLSSDVTLPPSDTALPSSLPPPSKEPSQIVEAERPTVLITEQQLAEQRTVIRQEAVTGQNESVDRASAAAELISIDTATATARAAVSTVTNTSLIGRDGSFGEARITEPVTGTIDFSTISVPAASGGPNAVSSGATPAAQIVSVIATQSASITTDIGQRAITGENSLIPTIPSPAENEETATASAAVTTGSATADAVVSTIANTALIGDCYSFNILSVFAPINGSILLPNEEDYLHCGRAALSPVEVQIDSQATSTTEITAVAESGTNAGSGSSASVVTGVAQTQSIVFDRTNETFIDNNWALLRIFNPQNILGSLLLEGGYSEYIDSVLYYWWRLGSAQAVGHQGTIFSDSLRVSVTNAAQQRTTISQQAISGRNTVRVIGAGNSQTQTGNASARADVIHYLNTTIIGSNWYLFDLNLFDTVSGDVQTAKPDLAVQVSASQLEFQIGSQAVVGYVIGNQGSSGTAASSFGVTVPSELSITEASAGGTVVGSSVVWHIPALAKGERVIVWVKVQANGISNQTNITAMIDYARTELTKNNNYVSVPVRIYERPVALSSQSARVISHQTSEQNTTPVYQRVNGQQVGPLMRPRPLQQFVRVPARSTLVGNHQLLNPEVLGSEVVMSGNPLIPTAHASDGTNGSSFCDRNLSICRGIRTVFWSSMAIGSAVMVRSRWRRWLATG